MKRYLKMFLLTFLILFTILLILQIYPFSNKTLIVTDLRDQYLVFINYLKNIVIGNNSLFYTFSGSLGESFLPLASYYLMSVFNLFTLPFEGDLMPLVLTFIILIKISLSSVSMLYFLDKRKNQKLTNYIFALSYGLMSYNIAFYFHIMWLDAIILLPLVALGIENVINKNKSSLYITALSLTIISNYYIGVIVCIFSVMYFIYYYLMNNKKEYQFKKIFLKYCLSSFLSGMIAMFILLPNIFALASSKAMIGNDLEVIAHKFNTPEILSKILNLSFDGNSIWHGGPNIFVGSLIILLIIIYFFNKKINTRNKIISLVFLIVLFLTCRIHFLDLIFHGFSEPNCFDFRQAFIISFFLIMIGYESFNNLSKIDNKKMILLGIFVFHLIIYFLNLSYFSGIRSLSLVLSFITFAAIIYLIFQKNYKLLFGIVILELMVNAINIISTITIYEMRASNVSEYQEYFVKNDETINRIKEVDNSFYRLEKDYHFSNSINDSMLFGYYGISHFDSTSNANTEKLLENLGFRRVVSRAFYGNGSTKAVDMLLGIKYVLSNSNHFDYPLFFTMNDINVLRNDKYLVPVFTFKKNQNMNYTENVFDNLNNLFDKLTGINNLYHKVDYEIKYYNVKKEGNTYYKTLDNAYIEYKFYPESGYNYYLYFLDNLVRDNYKTADIYVNDTCYEDYFTKYNYSMINLGELSDEVIIKIVLNDDEITFEDGLIYYEDAIILKKIYNILNQDNELIIDGNKLQVLINNPSDTDVLLMIPYEEGWSVYVDNKEVDYENYGGFISFKINNNTQKIELSFYPKGLKVGIIISLLALGGSFVLGRKEKYEK